MSPADAIVRAAARWIHALRTSTPEQAWSLIRTDANYADLTQTQYLSALEWLRGLNLVIDGPEGVQLSLAVKKLREAETNQLLFERCLEHAAPAWLPDADLLIPDESELPQDAAGLARTLGLSDRRALLAIRYVHGRIDPAERARVGSAGELALRALLENCWPGSTTYVAQSDDGFGYDLLFRLNSSEWQLEVKSTTRRGRLGVYLSRHEHEVGMSEPNWCLVVIGLDDRLNAQALATVRHAEVLRRAPSDVFAEAKWQSTLHQLSPSDLQRGLSFLDWQLIQSESASAHLLRSGHSVAVTEFAWMP